MTEHGRAEATSQRAAFTLIEVLVVVAIIALLIAILLPALSEARKEARAIACAANLHHVGQAAAIYTNRSKGYLPPSYLYAYDDRGNYRLQDQYFEAPNPSGYLHWSWFLYNDGRVDEKAFQCPELPNGGHPRTNPGREGWVGGQVDDLGNAAPGQITDKQAPWMAYTANAALMSRNKFVSTGPDDRHNVFVSESLVRSPSKTIMVTEFGPNFENVSVQKGSGRLSKSHRPVHPFYDAFSSAYDLYATGAGTMRPGQPIPFTYGDVDPAATGPGKGIAGILEVGRYETKPDIIDDKSEVNKLNCVGRQHPGGGIKQFGGTANFLYADSHVERKNVVDTLLQKEWGDRFYSLAGDNRVNMKKSPPDYLGN